MKKIFTAVFCLLVALTSNAQDAPALLMGSDPVSFSKAGATVAGKAGAYAVENNAAAMSLSESKMSVAASYAMWAPSSVKNGIAGLGAFFKAGSRFAIGLGGRYIMGNPYDVTSASGGVISTQKPADIAAQLGASYAVVDGLSVGLTAKFLSSKLADDLSGSAFGADLSLAYTNGALSAGLAACNLGSKLRYSSGSEVSLPAMVKGGASYSVAGFTASAEADYLFSGAFMAGLGLEYSIKEIAFLRAGYHYGDQKKALVSFASLGLGLRFAGVELNACYLLGSEALGNTMMFGLGYSF